MTDMQSLSPLFLSRMEALLGEAYPAFLHSYEQPRTYGLRVNTSKLSLEEFHQEVPFAVTPIPWIENGFYYKEEDRPSRCPMYQAGLYYLQDPSAMTPASRLPVFPGERVLDLCAAPGGKATALGSALKGQGLLVANDISACRAKALLRNLELFGITNALVTSEAPAKLAQRFPLYFHKILLDAPCSGEGMFRKEEALAKDWTPEKSRDLSLIQKQLMEQAADMLCPGGLLLYSTCTFSPCEDEEVVSHLLSVRPEMELLPMEGYEGFAPGELPLTDCVRIFPHRMEGEGHFLALLRKRKENEAPGSAPTWEECKKASPFPDLLSATLPLSAPSPSERPQKTKTGRKGRQAGKDASLGLSLLLSFLEEIGLTSLGGQPFSPSRVEIRGDKVYYLPPLAAELRGLNFLRCGLHLGELKKDRFEPAQPFALALHPEDVSRAISLPICDERLTRYLQGEPISLSQTEGAGEKGWRVLSAAGHPLAFGKVVGSTLKNKVPAGWRTTPAR